MQNLFVKAIKVFPHACEVFCVYIFEKLFVQHLVAYTFFRLDSWSKEMSIIVAGGENGELVMPVEILDEGANNWRQVRDIPVGLHRSQLVEVFDGSVVFVGGTTCIQSKNCSSDRLFQLHHAGDEAEWLEMEERLNISRSYHSAFLIPDTITDCF